MFVNQLRIILLILNVCFLITGNDLNILGNHFKKYVNLVKNQTDIDLVFLVDASSSVGEDNFASELRFVRKVLSDLTVTEDHTRIALITFGSRDSVFTHINSISDRDHLDKCILLNEFLPKTKYSGGGTYTLGAFQTAKQILLDATRNSSQQAVFLITDGFSNGGDPTPIAQELKEKHNITIFTIGIKTGRSQELEAISSHSETNYLLDNFKEFEALARRALHKDLQDGEYVTVEWGKCRNLCEPNRADCTCGIGNGQYTCRCRRGYYGDGETCQWCPKGTWHRAEDGICIPCSDPNHESFQALSSKGCICKKGYKDDGSGMCEVIHCPKLSPPENGYFVGNPNNCQNVINNACGVRCHVGYSLRGNSIRLCQENATWNGVEPQCIIKTCARPPIPQFGQIVQCSNSDLDVVYNTTSFPDDMPVDTECSFGCDKGHAISGSLQRTCLPISQWDGLRTTCRPIKCHRLGKVLFGTWEPEICGRERQTSETQCKLVCKRGFISSDDSVICRASIRGPGKWNATGLKCIDKDPPQIECPKDKIIETEDGLHFGLLQLDAPTVKDNSGTEVILWADPMILPDEDNDTNTTSEWNLAALNQFEIGVTVVTFHAVDQFGNEATCDITIKVVDKQPPTIKNCEDPAPFLTYNPANVTISWDEPLIFDNSQEPITVTRSRDFGIFEAGITEVVYTAVDKYNNTNTCIINITVIAEATCETPPGDHSICNPNPGGSGVTCAMTCQEGYGFALTDAAICLHDAPGLWDVPECSPMVPPENIWDTFHAEINCTDNSTIESLGAIIQEYGGIVIMPNCSSPGRSRRDIDPRYIQQVEFLTKQPNRLLEAATNLGINTTKGEQLVVCKNGSVLQTRNLKQKNRCVLCPKGTYEKNRRCVPCPQDTFSSKPGSLVCEACPAFRSTLGRKRAKSKRACKAVCPPSTKKKGIVCETKPRRKQICQEGICKNGGQCTIRNNRFKCICNTGWAGSRCRIQSRRCLCQNGGSCNEDQTLCFCPKGFAGNYCELEDADLLPEFAEISVTKPCDLIQNLCENNGTCMDDSLGGYTCKCPPGFLGKRCNILPCDYSPCPPTTLCRNILEENATKSSIKCECPEGRRTPPNCLEIINKCSPNPCLNEGQCTSEADSFKCNCKGAFHGEKCEEEKDSKYVAHFPRIGTNDYLIIDGPKLNLTEFSMCVWVQSNDRENYGTILSYANYDYDNAFTVTDYSGLVLYINGRSVVSDIRLNDGKWNHLCITWSMEQGTYNFYVNSKLVVSGEGLSTKNPVAGKGKIVLGQEQDAVGGRFSQTEAFKGKLTFLHIWSKALTKQQIELIRDDCTEFGDLVHWADFRNNTKGLVRIEESTFCSNCSFPNYIANGNIIITSEGKTAIYSCQPGYQIYFNKHEIKDKSFTRKCTASSIWESDEDPTCQPILCPYAGYVPHARVQGKFYNTRYKDKLIYTCYAGYEPQEPQTRTCLENGTWSLPPPLCKGGQCEPFLKPLNSNLTIISEHDFDENFEKNRLFEIGTQVEIGCLDGTQLLGEKIISCQENGTWDNEIPECRSPSCAAYQMPPIPPNSYTLDEIAVTFEVEAVVSFKCRNGYFPLGDDYTKCLPNGKWLTLNLVCSPIECIDEPPSYENMEYTNGYNITKYFFGNMLKYECNEGYIFYGTNTIRCLSTGKWSKLKGKCARVSCNKPNIQSGETIIGSSYLFKDSLRIICPKGSASQEYSMRCTSSKKWLQIGDCKTNI